MSSGESWTVVKAKKEKKPCTKGAAGNKQSQSNTDTFGPKIFSEKGKRIRDEGGINVAIKVNDAGKGPKFAPETSDSGERKVSNGNRSGGNGRVFSAEFKGHRTYGKGPKTETQNYKVQDCASDKGGGNGFNSGNCKKIQPAKQGPPSSSIITKGDAVNPRRAEEKQKLIETDTFPSTQNQNKIGPVPSSGSSGTVPQKNKTKRSSKLERQRKREAKFWEQHCANKDSHIQFVSVDVIKQIQEQKAKNAKPSVKPSVFKGPEPLSTTVAKGFVPTKWPCNEFDAGLGSSKSELDFPALTPSPSTSKEFKTPIVNHQLNQITEEDQLDSIAADPSQLNSPPVRNDSVELPSPKPTNNFVTPPSVSKTRKSKQPMVIDVSSLIVSKKKDPEKRVTTSAGLGRSGARTENFKVTAGNPLDSSGPGVIHRGKIRLKKKKPTKLKLTIMKSRSLRKMLQEEKLKQEERESKVGHPNEKEADEFENKKTSLPLFNTHDNADLLEDNPDQLEPSRSTDAEVDKIQNEKIVQKEEGTISNSNIQSNPSDSNNCIENTSVNVDKEQESDTDLSQTFLKLLDETSTLKIGQTGVSLEVEMAIKKSMHNRKFRDYCDMYTSGQLHGLVSKLLRDLHKFQDRLYHTDPIKFKTKRRYVSGLKEAVSYLSLNKVQLLIIAPDIERNAEPGGLDERIGQILESARGRNVPYIFSGSKYNLGKPIKFKTPISIVSILDKQNCEDTFREILEEANRLREKYQNEFLSRARKMSNL